MVSVLGEPHISSFSGTLCFNIHYAFEDQGHLERTQTIACKARPQPTLATWPRGGKRRLRLRSGCFWTPLIEGSLSQAVNVFVTRLGRLESVSSSKMNPRPAKDWTLRGAKPQIVGCHVPTASSSCTSTKRRPMACVPKSVPRAHRCIAEAWIGAPKTT